MGYPFEVYSVSRVHTICRVRNIKRMRKGESGIAQRIETEAEGDSCIERYYGPRDIGEIE